MHPYWVPPSESGILSAGLGFFLKRGRAHRAAGYLSKTCAVALPVGEHRSDLGMSVSAGRNLGVGQGEVAADKEGRFRAEGLIPGMTYALTRRNVAGTNYKMVARDLSYMVVEPGKNKDVGDLKIAN
jgi:hypothetical protein